MTLTKDEFHNVVKKYGQIKLLDNYEKDREFMYLNDCLLGWYDDEINAVRIINRFIIADDNYGHLFINTPTALALINMRKIENFFTKLGKLIKQYKQLKIEIAKNTLEKDFKNGN